MKALWWFEENQIAGMGRPGFNCTHFFEYPYDEAVLMGWLGRFSSGKALRKSLEEHMKTFCPKVAPFYGISEKENQAIIEKYFVSKGLIEGLSKISQRTKLLKNFDVTDQEIHFDFCHNRLDEEISKLKNMGIKSIVSLTEEHHSADALANHFKAHHLSINDLDAPSMEQVHEMAQILEKSKKDKEPLVVHCLAGIGRTSTMLIAGHLVLGHDLPSLMKLIEEKNPTYTLTGRQKEIIETVQYSLK